MTVFRVSRTHVAVLKLEGVNEGEGKGEGGFGRGRCRVNCLQQLLSLRLVLLRATTVHCTRKTSAAAHHRERRKMTPRVFLLRCFRDHFSSPTQLRTNNDYDHWCQFQGGYRTGPRRCPRTSTHASKSIAAVCGGVCAACRCG